MFRMCKTYELWLTVLNGGFSFLEGQGKVR